MPKQTLGQLALALYPRLVEWADPAHRANFRFDPGAEAATQVLALVQCHLAATLHAVLDEMAAAQAGLDPGRFLVWMDEHVASPRAVPANVTYAAQWRLISLDADASEGESLAAAQAQLLERMRWQLLLLLIRADALWLLMQAQPGAEIRAHASDAQATLATAAIPWLYDVRQLSQALEDATLFTLARVGRPYADALVAEIGFWMETIGADELLRQVAANANEGRALETGLSPDAIDAWRDRRPLPRPPRMTRDRTYFTRSPLEQDETVTEDALARLNLGAPLAATEPSAPATS